MATPSKVDIPWDGLTTASKLTMFFEGGNFGWSESWYFPAMNTATADATVKNICLARHKCLAKPWKLTAARVSNPKVRGSAQGFPVPASQADQPEGGDDPFWGVIVSVRGDTKIPNIDSPGYYRRNFIIRGLPGAWTAANAIASGVGLAPVNAGPVEQYMQALIGNGAKLKIIDKTGAGGSIDEVLASANLATCKLQLVGNALCSAGDVIKLSGFSRGYKYLNGERNVLSVTVGPPDLVEIDVPFQPQVYVPTARYRVSKYTLALVTSFQLGRLARKNTGRPTSGTAGKYKTKQLST